MEKDQLDSLATVAVGSEKIPPPPHSYYAPSDVYSSSESPPAYTRPGSKSSAVQIAKIIAVTLIPISVIIGSFVLASVWLQAHSETTSDFITVLKSQIGVQQQQNELFKHLQPEALVQEPIENKDNLQSINSIPQNSPINPKFDDKNAKTADELEANNNNNNNNDDQDNSNKRVETNDSTEDYDDLGELSPVRIKLPVQLDLEELAGTLLQQTQGFVSCVVERKKSNDPQKDDAGLSNNVQRIFKVINNERVTILCESKEPPRKESQEQDIRSPIIIPLGNLQIPMEQNYHRYPIQNPSSYGVNNFEQMIVPSELKHIQNIVEMGLQRMGFPNGQNQQMEIHPVPIELRPVSVEMIKGMRPPMLAEQPIPEHQQPMYQLQPQQPQQQQQQQQPQPQPQPHQQTLYQQHMYAQDLQIPHGMMPPPPPPPSPSSPQSLPQTQSSPQEIMIHQQMEEKTVQPQENSDKSSPSFPNLPFEIKRIIQQVPIEIKDIIQHITGQVRHIPSVPEGARREPVQEFKSFPMNPIHMNGIRNFLENGNIENQSQNSYDNQQEDEEEEEEEEEEEMKEVAKAIKNNEKDVQDQEDANNGEEIDTKNLLPPEVKNIIHRFIQGPFEMSFQRFLRPLRPFKTLEVPLGVSTRVAVEPENIQQQPQQQPQQNSEVHQTQQAPQQPEINDRPHYVQPRSVV